MLSIQIELKRDGLTVSIPIDHEVERVHALEYRSLGGRHCGPGNAADLVPNKGTYHASGLGFAIDEYI